MSGTTEGAPATVSPAASAAANCANSGQEHMWRSGDDVSLPNWRALGEVRLTQQLGSYVAAVPRRARVH